MLMEDYLKKAKIPELEKLLKSGGRKILVYHSDVDGMCSAALLMKFFPGFKPVPREGPVIDDGFLEVLVSKKPDAVVFIDIPADQEWKKLVALKRRVRGVGIAVIDHHIVEKDVNSLGMIHVNPRFDSREIYIPASAVMYEILKFLEYPAERFLWVSAVGVIADYGFEDCRELLEECEKAYPGSLSDKPSPFKLSRIAEMLSSIITLKGLKGARMGLDLLVRFDTLKEIRNHGDLREYYRKVKREIDRITEDFGKHAEFVPGKDLIIYEIRSKLNITSIIATKITDTYRDEVVLIRKKSRQGWKVSLRCQSGKVNVGDLAKKASKGIGSGGGHRKSAGALVKDWDMFRERIVKQV